MKSILHLLALAAAFTAGAAVLAQSPPPNANSKKAHSIPPAKQKFYYHYEWMKGAVLSSQEWNNGAKIDHPRQQGLTPAPKGEEWREIDRNYILVSSSTHKIERVKAAPHPTPPGQSGGQP